MNEYVKLTMIFEPGNGSTLDIDTLKSAVIYSGQHFVPEPKVVHVEVLEAESVAELAGDHDNA